MATPTSNLDCETICVDHNAAENGRSLIQRREIASEGKLSDIESITRSEFYGLKKRRNSWSDFKPRRSFPCVWALCTSVLFLLVSAVGIVKFVQISSEMDELREQFTVSAFFNFCRMLILWFLLRKNTIDICTVYWKKISINFCSGHLIDKTHNLLLRKIILNLLIFSHCN